MKNLLTLILFLNFQSITLAQVYYSKIMFNGSGKILKNVNDEYFLYGTRYNSGSDDDVFFTRINPDNGDYYQMNYIGTSTIDLSSSMVLANSGNDFVYSAYSPEIDSIFFGLINSNGVVTNHHQLLFNNLTSSPKTVQSQNNEFIVLTGRTTSSGDSNIFIEKYGIDGDLIWATELGDTSINEYGVDILKTLNNTYMIIGQRQVGVFDNRSIAAFEVNESGDKIWEMEYENGNDLHLIKIKQLEENKYSILINEGPMLASSSDDHIKLISINGSGNIVDSMIVSDNNKGIFASDFLFTDDHFVFVGGISGDLAATDNFLIKTDSIGEPIWSAIHHIPPSSSTTSTNSSFRSIIELNDGYLISGSWFNGSFIKGTLYKVNKLGNFTRLQDLENGLEISVFPNPTNDVLYIKSDRKFKYDLSFYNLNGQLIYTKLGLEGDHEFSLKNLSESNQIVVRIDINGKLAKSKIIFLE